MTGAVAANIKNPRLVTSTMLRTLPPPGTFFNPKDFSFAHCGSFVRVCCLDPGRYRVGNPRESPGHY